MALVRDSSRSVYANVSRNTKRNSENRQRQQQQQQQGSKSRLLEERYVTAIIPLLSLHTIQLVFVELRSLLDQAERKQ